MFKILIRDKSFAFTFVMRYRMRFFKTSTELNGGSLLSLKKCNCLSEASLTFLESQEME